MALSQQQINFNRLPVDQQQKQINDSFMNTGMQGRNAFETKALQDNAKAERANTQKVIQLQDAAKKAVTTPISAPPPNQVNNNQVNSGVSVASTLAKPEAYNPTNDINAQASARESAAIAAFERKKAAALAALEEERQKIDPYYDTAKQGVSVKSQQTSRNLAEYLAATGRIKSGANEQRALSRDVALQGNLGSLESQRVSAQQAIDRQKTTAMTTAESDLEALRQNIYADKMLQEIQAKQNAANQQVAQYNADRGYGLQERQLGAEVTGYDPITGKATFANTQANRNFGLAESGVTGNYNGNRTIQGQQLDFNKGVTEAGLTGQYDGQRTLQGQEFDVNKDNTRFNQGIATAGITGDYNGQRTLQGQQVDSSIATNKLQQAGLKIENLINQYKLDESLPLEVKRAKQLISIGEAELAAKIFENSNAPEKFKMDMAKAAESIAASKEQTAQGWKQLDISQQNTDIARSKGSGSGSQKQSPYFNDVSKDINSFVSNLDENRTIKNLSMPGSPEHKQFVNAVGNAVKNNLITDSEAEYLHDFYNVPYSNDGQPQQQMMYQQPQQQGSIYTNRITAGSISPNLNAIISNKENNTVKPRGFGDLNNLVR